MAPTADTVALGEERISSNGQIEHEQDLQLPYTPRGPDPGGGRMQILEESLSMAARLSPPLVGTQSELLSLPPKKASPPPYAASSLRLGAGALLGYPSTFMSGQASASHLPPDSGSSFTNTFLRGILTSIDSKDPVVANAWLETLLDAIDLLPADVIKREVVLIAVAKGQLGQTDLSRRSACRLLGKIAAKLDSASVRTELLPTALALCQDSEPEVRHCMCRHLGFVAMGVGLEAAKATVLPQLVDLSNDESAQVRLAALETVVHLLSMLDDDTCVQTIVPLVVKSCEQAKQAEDECLPNVAHHLGRLCHGLSPNLSGEQRAWFLGFYRHLSRLGLGTNNTVQLTSSSSNPRGSDPLGPSPMPDLVPSSETSLNISPEKTELYVSVRRECAFNFPAMVLFVGPSAFTETLYPTFNDLACDAHAYVRRTLASSLHEVAKMVGPAFALAKTQVRNLFADESIPVLEAMVANLVHVIDALARHGVLQFGQAGQYSEDLSAALLRCEERVARTRDWRLHADCLEKFSCLANCISSSTIQTKFIPMLFSRILRTRALPCRTAAARTLLVILRFTIKMEDRTRVMFRIREELARAPSCHTRMLFLRLCDMALALFSKSYFKQHFFAGCLRLACDKVANVRLRLCVMLPRLKALLYLPSDRGLLMLLEDTVKELMALEVDRDVRGGLQTAIDELDRTEMGVDGVPSMDEEEDRENERKLREERLIYSMEEQINRINGVGGEPPPLPPGRTASPSMNPRWRDLTGESSRRRSESLPPALSRAYITSSMSDATSSYMNGGHKPRYGSPEPSGVYNPNTSVPPSNMDSWEVNYRANEFSPMSNVAANSNSAYATNASAATRLSDNGGAGVNNAAGGGGGNGVFPYSSSLENLDPSAREFMVDAGVTLDTASLLSSATSMPNLSKLNSDSNASSSQQQQQQMTTSSNGLGGSSNLSQSSLPNLEGQFSRFLISNEEMERYEAEYQKASREISQQAALQKQQQQQQQQQSKLESKLRQPSLSSLTATSSSTLSNGSLLRPPSASSSPQKQMYTSSALTASTVSAPGSVTAAGTAGSGLPRFSYQMQSKLTSSTDKLQGSIERLAEKWEAKRKNLTSMASTNSFDDLDPPPAPAPSQSATSSPQRLLRQTTANSIKQRAPSLMKAPAQKRLSLTDQVGLVGRQAVERFILPKRKSMHLVYSTESGGSGSGSEGELMGGAARRMNGSLYRPATALVTTSINNDSASEGDSIDSGRKSSDEELPPYPQTDPRYHPETVTSSSTVIPLPPPPTSLESMSTYVPPRSNMSSMGAGQPSSLVITEQRSSSLIVKPIASSSSSSSQTMSSHLRAPQTRPNGGRIAPPRTLPQTPRTSLTQHQQLSGNNWKPNNHAQMLSPETPSPPIMSPELSPTCTLMSPTSPVRRQIPPPPVRSSKLQQPLGGRTAGGSNPPPYNRPPMYTGHGRQQQQQQPPSQLRTMNSAPALNIANTRGQQYMRQPQSVQQQQPQQQRQINGTPSLLPTSPTEQTSQGRKFTRLPPPRYRAHQPPSGRRPLSHQEAQNGNLRNSQNGSKSLSAESINDYEPELPPQQATRTPSSNPAAISPYIVPYDAAQEQSVAAAKRLSQNNSNSVAEVGSGAVQRPESPIEEQQPISYGGGRSMLPSTGVRGMSASGMIGRRSSGMRMWQQQHQQQQGGRALHRPTSAPEHLNGDPSAAPGRLNRSPSPTQQQQQQQQQQRQMQQQQSRLRRPGTSSASSLSQPPPPPAPSSPQRRIGGGMYQQQQQQQQRTSAAAQSSYGAGSHLPRAGAAAAAGRAQPVNARSSSAGHNGSSPGQQSRPESPQQMRRRSSHYPNAAPSTQQQQQSPMKYQQQPAAASSGLPRYGGGGGQSSGRQLPTPGQQQRPGRLAYQPQQQQQPSTPTSNLRSPSGSGIPSSHQRHATVGLPVPNGYGLRRPAAATSSQQQQQFNHGQRTM